MGQCPRNPNAVSMSRVRSVGPGMTNIQLIPRLPPSALDDLRSAHQPETVAIGRHNAGRTSAGNPASGFLIIVAKAERNDINCK